MNALNRAINICGGITRLAEILGTKQPVVSNWVARKNIPPERVIPIEQATKGQVTRHELRPDIYPAESQQIKHIKPDHP